MKPLQYQYSSLFTGLVLFILTSFVCVNITRASDWQGVINLQTRFYTQTGANTGEQIYPSLGAELSKDTVISDDLDFTMKAKLREDANDSERSSVDIRELFWRYYDDAIEYGLGIGQTNWGVNELFKTVDKLNQIDRREAPFSQKLGQPMFSVSGEFGGHSMDAYILYDVRQAWFPGEDGRLRYPLLTDEDNAIYDREDASRFDIAARYKTQIKDLEIGVSHFYGMSRDAYFVFNGDFNNPRLLPVYEKVNRTALSLQYSLSDMLVKGEFAYQMGGVEQYESVAGGIEYVYGTVFDSDVELTLYIEAIWDSRENIPTSLFDHDIGVATRFNFNDVNDSFLVLGAIVDYEYKEAVSYGLLKRNIGNKWSCSLLGQYFHAGEPRTSAKEFQASANALLNEIDANNYPLPALVIDQIVTAFSGVTMNKKQFDIVSEQLYALQNDPAYVNTLDIETVPQTLFDLLRVSDNSQKMNLIERDSYIQIDINYHF